MATAFAVYCADDTSLSFYKRDSVPTAGSTFEGKVVSEVYTGIEEEVYSGTSPWYNNRTNITNVTFVDIIAPISTAYWFFQFANANLTIINGLDKLDTSNITDMSWMFYDCKALTTLDLSNFNTSNVTNMTNMFSNCKALTALDLSNFNTSNVIYMNNMFCNCNALTILNLSNFNTSNVTNMMQMFSGCSKLTTLDLSSFNTSNVANMRSMFSTCIALTALDLSSFDTSNVTSMREMFYNCVALTTIYISDMWSTVSVTNGSYIFDECANLVGAVPYDSSKTDHTMANYETGYLTLKRYYEYLISEDTLISLGDAVRKATQTTEKLTFSQMQSALKEVGVFVEDFGDGEINLRITPATVTYSDGEVFVK